MIFGQEVKGGRGERREGWDFSWGFLGVWDEGRSMSWVIPGKLGRLIHGNP